MSTRAGTVRLVGSVFSVEVVDGGPVVVRALEGTVQVEAAGWTSRSVHAGEELNVTAPESTALSREESARDRALLAGVTAEAIPTATPEPTALPSATPEPSPAIEVPPPPTAAVMLLRARELRARGRFAASAEAYRALRATHRQSGEARAALVSLGELELAQLGDPSGALQSFEAYLARGGPLGQEAEYGRIRALRALGRTAAEVQAIEGFLAAHPSSAQERPLRARLEAVQGDGGR